MHVKLPDKHMRSAEKWQFCQRLPLRAFVGQFERQQASKSPAHQKIQQCVCRGGTPKAPLEIVESHECPSRCTPIEAIINRC